MKFVIKREVKTIMRREVDIELRNVSGGAILLKVDGWSVFKLNVDGTGCLYKYISSNGALQVDKDGRIVIEEE